MKGGFEKMKKETILKLAAVFLAFGVSAPSAVMTYTHTKIHFLIIIVAAVLAFVVLYFVFRYMFVLIAHCGRAFNRLIDSTSIETLMGGTLGLLVGVLLGLLAGIPFSNLKIIGAFLPVIILFIFSYYGLRIGTRRSHDLLKGVPFLKKQPREDKKTPLPEQRKVVDTSAVIDGRIYDVALSRFLEGTLVVPGFVIEELQHIADSEDSIRRSKGRRGLDLLAKMQKHSDIRMEITDDPIPEEKEVDLKLIRLCKKLEAPIITNDFNLNKVAQLQGIKVLNLNELANAVKFIIYPGEFMDINIIKEGKESGQGVGYLDDGTMVVVENARALVGQNVHVVVTSVFQTAAGRMIFTRRGKEEKLMLTEKIDDSLPGVNAFG
jgi:uncharacterized protein YacL